MASATPDQRLPSQRRASPPFDRYQIILLGEQRHVCEQRAHATIHEQ